MLGWQNGSVDTAACCQACQHELNPWNIHSERRELTHAGCSLTWHLQMYTHK